MFYFYFYFFHLQVFTATFIFFASNPIHSILLLVLLFCESAIVLSIFQLEFISLLFILVYVGAIAVLFLFVVMMLRIKLSDTTILFFLPLNFILNFFCFFYIFYIYQPFIFSSDLFYYCKNISFLNIEEKIIEIFIIGQILYNYYLNTLLLAGFILLLALIGAVILSLDFNKTVLNRVDPIDLGRSAHITTFL